MASRMTTPAAVPTTPDDRGRPRVPKPLGPLPQDGPAPPVRITHRIRIPRLRCVRQRGDGRMHHGSRAQAGTRAATASRAGAQDGQSTLDRRDRADTAPFAGTKRRAFPRAGRGLPSGERPQRPLPDGYAVRQWRSGGVRQLRLQRMTVAVCCLLSAVCCLGRGLVHRP
jgi:hypothetical protein